MSKFFQRIFLKILKFLLFSKSMTSFSFRNPLKKKKKTPTFFKNTVIMKSFGLILQNLNFICIIGTVKSYLGLWGKRVNFGITIAEIQQKVWERRRKRGREKMLNFGNVNIKIPLPGYEVCVECPKWKEKKILWQTNCGNAIAEIGGKKFCNNCGNGIVENGGKKKVVPKFGEA